MNIEQLKNSGLIIHECVVGSHLYGTNKEGSDVDVKGVFILPTEKILSGQYIEQVSDDKQDTTYYEIGRFIELLSNGNPNIVDILGSDLVNFTTDKWKEYFPDSTPFITTKFKHTFLGYSYSQIQKAKGMNKKTNWEKSRMERKTPLDFCYVLRGKEKSVSFKSYCENHSLYQIRSGNHRAIGLASVNNFPDLYSMYLLGVTELNGEIEWLGGIINENSNDVQLKSIPKDAEHLGYLRFDRNAYSTHCKDYREYQEWLKKRNPLRYEDNGKVDNLFDTKNLSHCVRLLYTVKDIALGKGLILRRPERQQLIDIRNGLCTYEQIIELATSLEEEVKQLFETSTLPRSVNQKYIQDLLLKIRLENFGNKNI